MPLPLCWKKYVSSSKVSSLFGGWLLRVGQFRGFGAIEAEACAARVCAERPKGRTAKPLDLRLTGSIGCVGSAKIVQTLLSRWAPHN